MNRFLITVFCGFFFLTQPLTAQDISPELKADIIRLIIASGADQEILNQAETVADELIAPVKIVRTDITEERFVAIKQEIMDFVKEELGGEDSIFDSLIPLYAKHYTQDEIKALTDFYESPIGQKSLQVGPMISAESNAAYE